MPTSILRVCLVTESAWTFSIGQPSLAESPNQGFRALSSVPLWWKSERETIRFQKKNRKPCFDLYVHPIYLEKGWKRLKFVCTPRGMERSYHKKLRWKRPTNPRTSRCSRYLVAGKKSWSFVPAQFLNADLQKPRRNVIDPKLIFLCTNKDGRCSKHFPWCWNLIFPDSARHNFFICPKIRYHHPILNCL